MSRQACYVTDHLTLNVIKTIRSLALDLSRFFGTVRPRPNYERDKPSGHRRVKKRCAMSAYIGSERISLSLMIQLIDHLSDTPLVPTHSLFKTGHQALRATSLHTPDRVTLLPPQPEHHSSHRFTSSPITTMSTFPQPFLSSISHWQATNRGPTSLYNHNSEKSLPKETDILIVGGGTMGASLSYFLTHDGYTESTNDTHKSTNRPRITLLEAKDIASGASGRNGGHVGPATFSAWTTLQQPIPFGAGLSEEEATRVIHAERENLDLIEEVVKREGLEGKVDWWRGDLCEGELRVAFLSGDQLVALFSLEWNGSGPNEVTFNDLPPYSLLYPDTFPSLLLTVHHSPTSPSALLSSYQSWLHSRSTHLNLSPSTSNTTLITDPHQASAIARMDKAIAVQLRPAGSVHSHKLCTELMRCAMEVRDGKGVELFSWTVVESMDPIDQSSSALDQDVSRQRGEGEGEAKDAEAYKWRVKTNKGMIKAKKVVLCTNAHTQNFFEEGDPLHDQ